MGRTVRRFSVNSGIMANALRVSGGKKTSNQAASSEAATAAGRPTEISVRKEEALARKQALKDREWPTLRAKAVAERDPELLDAREDLAALHANLMEAKQKHTPAVAVSAASGGQQRNTGQICVGDRVEARFDGRLEWFPATVTKVKTIYDMPRYKIPNANSLV